MKRKRLIVMGFMGSIPIGGVIWQHIHYIVGLQRLGHEVYYIEDSARTPYNAATGEFDPDFSYAARFLRKLARDFGFENRWSFCARYLPEKPTAGLSRPKILQLYREADAILNVCGSQELHEDIAVNQHIIYIDSDPGYEQIKVDQGRTRTIALLRRHQSLFSFGENVGTRAFPVPAHGLKWMPTRQPVVTEFWKAAAPPRGAKFTTVANWNTSGLKDIRWRGERYLWSKSREFLRFCEAPERAGETFELATTIRDPRISGRFEKHGWRLAPSFKMSADWWKYLGYLQNSKGEFTVAKDQYVRLKTGWFSDRSACYLAAGRPVITQQTGFTKFYGGESGLFAFTSLEEIADAVERINADYQHHSRAARALAREVFEATTVLKSLLNRAGV